MYSLPCIFMDTSGVVDEQICRYQAFVYCSQRCFHHYFERDPHVPDTN